MAESLAEFFLSNFQAHRDERAYGQRCGYRMEWFTYGKVLKMAVRFCGELRERGIGKGDRVMLWGENGAEWVAAPRTIPQTMTWTVVFDGKALGTIISITKASTSYGDVNTQALTAAPAEGILVKNGAADFSYTGDVSANSRSLARRW